MVGFLGCKCTLLVVFASHPPITLKSFSSGLHSTHPFSNQPVFVPGIVSTHMQDLVLGLVELHKVCTDPPLKPVKVPLDGITSLQDIDHTTWLGVVGKFAEGVSSSTDKDIEQHWSP